MNSEEKQYSEIRIADAIRQCDLKGIPRFVGFLSEAACAAAVKYAQKAKVKYRLYGGYDGAVRNYFGAFPDWCEPTDEAFPIVRLKINNKSNIKLTHRDVLGAVMSLGLERDTVGDILPDDKTAVLFVTESVADYIIAQIDKISSAGVVIERDFEENFTIKVSFSEKSDTVASNRLDCVIASLVNCSRGKAVELIESGCVAVGGVEVLKPTKTVFENDTVSVRRVGKFIIDGISDKTKKGRIVLKYRKYI